MSVSMLAAGFSDVPLSEWFLLALQDETHPHLLAEDPNAVS